MKKVFFTMILMFLSVGSIIPQEGMWMLNQIENLDLESKGLKIGVSDIYNTEKPALYNAIIQLGGGSASFVSKEGLIVTNHHVAYTAIQRASSEKNDYLKNGFLAKTRAEEIQAQGYVARVLLEMKDVTNEITSSVNEITDPQQRQRKIQEKIQAITDELEKGKTDILARVSQMYNGKEYYLFVYKTFKDVRLVYAPPESIGKFGGDTDNWMWPRHTGDFSFMRVYCSPDGTGLEYDPNNVPYKPIVWLKVSQTDLDDGDFTFILGFPGYTTRYRSSTSVHWNLNENYPFVIKNFREIIEMIDDLTKNSEEGRIKVASLKSNLANTQKNFEGKVEGMIKTNYLQEKIDFEKEFMSWLDKNPARKEKYGTVFSDEKKYYDILEKAKQKDNVLGWFGGLAGTPLSV
ncbi:MAG: S46 family peptidase, partial [Ignavibacteriaceae bacterium]|nr:S46 family peptidase [Ignavibacteriaceae bacterium]